MKRIVYTLLLLYIIISNIQAQKSVGEWSTYLSYYTTTGITEANNHVYAIANGSLYSYNKEDNSITHYSKQTGLSDNNINRICYNPEVNTLLIIYTNGNIDLLSENGIYNLSYLLDNSSVTDKTVNNIYLDKELAYLSTNFGIIVLNMDKKEIKDTYRLNRKVYSVTINNNIIYAATSEGLFSASLDSNLLDYNEWNSYQLPTTEFYQDSIKQICFYQDRLCIFANQSKNKGIYYQQPDGTIRSLFKNDNLSFMVTQNNKLMTYTGSTLYIYSSLSESDRDVINVGFIDNVTSLKNSNTFWIASGANGIKGIQKKNNSYEVILENTNDDTQYPKRNFNYFITTYDNKLMIIGGGRLTNRWGRPGTFMEYEDGKWFNFDENLINQSPKFRYFWDYTGVAVDPKNPERYFISSYGEGVVELINKEPTQLYNHTNSTLEYTTKGGNPFDYVRIGGVTFDKEGNLWMSNCEVESVLKVLKSDGTWGSFKFSNFTDVAMADRVTITSDNRKWINVPGGDKSGVFIFDDNGTIDDTSDDESRFIPTFTDSNGNIDASGYFCITEDKNAQVWIGTNRGPIICTNYRDINNISCTRIIRINNETGEPYYLLDGEQINAIAVDGGNRKWIGTQSSGIFLVSEDGMETISNFTTANSPLPSNQVNSIAIDQTTGEVFIGTENGLVSYMGDATEGSEDYSDVYAYPNPVRPEHNDRVTIVGLMNDSNVKITDMKGNIVYQGKSAGGTFTWDCRRKGGGRVATGIYLVLSATPEAKESVVTKIMVVK